MEYNFKSDVWKQIKGEFQRRLKKIPDVDGAARKTGQSVGMFLDSLLAEVEQDHQKDSRNLKLTTKSSGQPVVRQIKRFSLRALKSIDDERGGYEGEPSPFGELDLGGDVIYTGAFKQDLDFFKQTGWGGKNHDWSTDGQIAYPVEAYETKNGL